MLQKVLPVEAAADLLQPCEPPTLLGKGHHEVAQLQLAHFPNCTAAATSAWVDRRVSASPRAQQVSPRSGKREDARLDLKRKQERAMIILGSQQPMGHLAEAQDRAKLILEVRRLRLEMRNAEEELHVLETEVKNIDEAERQGEEEHQRVMREMTEEAEAFRLENKRLERSLQGANAETDRILEATRTKPGREKETLSRLQAECDNLEQENLCLAEEIERGRAELGCTRIGRLRGDGGSVEGTPRQHEQARTQSAVQSARSNVSNTRPSSRRGRSGCIKPPVAPQSEVHESEEAEALRPGSQRVERTSRGATAGADWVVEVAGTEPDSDDELLSRLQAECNDLEQENLCLADELERGRAKFACEFGDGEDVEGHW